MHYKITPLRDAFISEEYPTRNYGNDEILELTKVNSLKSNILIDFDFSDIKSKIDDGTLISGSTYVMNLYNVAFPTEDYVGLNYTIEAHLITGSWDAGYGIDVNYLDQWYEPNENWINWNNYTASLSEVASPVVTYFESSSYYTNLKLDVTELISQGITYEATTPSSGIVLTYSTAN